MPRRLLPPRRIALGLVALFCAAPGAVAVAADALPPGFVHLSAVDPTIVQDIRYAGPENFFGSRVPGYEAASCILTLAAAQALARVQARLAAGGDALVVFDCYRPARAVSAFVEWAGAASDTDPRYHPHVARNRLVAEGYIGTRSGHSRGSTVDVGTAAAGGGGGSPAPTCGDDARAMKDFGTGFDCFDPKSRTASPEVPVPARANRRALVDAMAAAGFRNYAGEWWHFTLADEPFPDRHFDFPVTAPE